jgi:hypothetical protein
VRFGDDEDFNGERWGTRDLDHVRKEDMTQYEVVPRGESPWCDGWEAILVENDTTETFIWRQEDRAEIQEVSLPRGLFTEVAIVACNWFEQLRSDRLGSGQPDPKFEVRLVRRQE